MRLIFYNLLVIALLVLPLLLLEVLRQRSAWIERYHGELSFGLWLVTLAGLYFWLFPLLGIKPNPALFDR